MEPPPAPGCSGFGPGWSTHNPGGSRKTRTLSTAYCTEAAVQQPTAPAGRVNSQGRIFLRPTAPPLASAPGGGGGGAAAACQSGRGARSSPPCSQAARSRARGSRGAVGGASLRGQHPAPGQASAGVARGSACPRTLFGTTVPVAAPPPRCRRARRRRCRGPAAQPPPAAGAARRSDGGLWGQALRRRPGPWGF